MMGCWPLLAALPLGSMTRSRRAQCTFRTFGRSRYLGCPRRSASEISCLRMRGLLLLRLPMQDGQRPHIRLAQPRAV